MGIIANELKNIITQLDNARLSINEKYKITQQEELKTLTINELPNAIDNISSLNTNDADATEDDIVNSKTAYVKGKKITGNITKWGSTSIGIKELKDNIFYLNIYPGYYTKDTKSLLAVGTISQEIGLKPEMIKKGEVVLGVVGTYEGNEPSEPEPEEPDTPEVSDAINLSEYFGDDLDRTYMAWGYEQLEKDNPNEEIQKEIYSRIYNAIKNNGNGTCYTYYNGVKSEECNCSITDKNGVNKIVVPIEDLNLNYQTDLSILSDVVPRVRYDNPELLFKKTSWSYTYTKGILDYLYFEYFTDEQKQEFLNACNQAFDEINDIIKSKVGLSYKEFDAEYPTLALKILATDSTQKVNIAKIIHDWLCVNNKYKEDWEDGSTDLDQLLTQTMYPALSKGVYDPVCASFGNAFKWCCNKWGIVCCNVIGGNKDGNHLWNMITYDVAPFTVGTWENSQWQEVDVTWDENGDSSKINWTYFNITTSELYSLDSTRERHLDRFTPTYPVENCTGSVYKYSGNTIYELVK